MKYLIALALSVTIVCSVISSCSRKVQIVCGISEVSQMGIDFVQPTIVAMERYKEDNGEYPKDIFNLVPKYIDKIPIVLHSKEDVDESKYNILIHEKLRGGVPRIEDDAGYFSIEFIPTDDRICLTGRNNICEYRSDTKQWGCYQH